MRLVKRFATLLLCAFAIQACASSPSAESAAGQPAPKGDHNVLLGTELRDLHFVNALVAVQTLRSNWLQTRGRDSYSSPSAVVVYLDNQKLGGTDTLRAIDIAGLGSIEHFDGTSATARWGVGHAAGAILVRSIGAMGASGARP